MEKIGTKELLWEFYKELNNNLSQYADLQSKYRLLGASWLIFGLGAIGFVFKEYSEHLNIQQELEIVGMIGIILGIGLYVVFTQDMLMYQKLIDGAYIEKRALEAANPWLPQVSNNIRRLLKGKGVKIQLRFYHFSIGLSILLGLVSLTLDWTNAIDIPENRVISALLIIFESSLVFFILYAFDRKTKTTEEQEKVTNFFEERKQQYLEYRNLSDDAEVENNPVNES